MSVTGISVTGIDYASIDLDTLRTVTSHAIEWQARFDRAKREALEEKEQRKAQARAEKEARNARVKTLQAQRKAEAKAERERLKAEEYGERERLNISDTKHRRFKRHGKPTSCPLCSVALEASNVAWDHDHELEHLPAEVQFRDWLCLTCNAGIGFLKESPEVLSKAAAYLQHHEERRRKILAQ